MAGEDWLKPPASLKPGHKCLFELKYLLFLYLRWSTPDIMILDDIGTFKNLHYSAVGDP